MARKLFIPAAAIVAAMLVTTVARTADEPRTPRAEQPGFDGKVVAIIVTQPSACTIVLENVRVQQIGGKSFLVGRGVDYGRKHDPYVGLTCWVPTEPVVLMTEFKNREEAIKSFESER